MWKTIKKWGVTLFLTTVVLSACAGIAEIVGKVIGINPRGQTIALNENENTPVSNGLLLLNAIRNREYKNELLSSEIFQGLTNSETLIQMINGLNETELLTYTLSDIDFSTPLIISARSLGYYQGVHQLDLHLGTTPGEGVRITLDGLKQFLNGVEVSTAYIDVNYHDIVLKNLTQPIVIGSTALSPGFEFKEGEPCGIIDETEIIISQGNPPSVLQHRQEMLRQSDQAVIYEIEEISDKTGRTNTIYLDWTAPGLRYGFVDVSLDSSALETITDFEKVCR